MPLFEYECRSCSQRFEQLVYDRALEVTCKRCGSTEVSQLLSTFAVSTPSGNPSVESGPCGSCGAAQRGMCGVE